MLGLPLPRITICGRWHRTQSACPHQKSRIDPSYPHPRILLCELDSHKFRKAALFRGALNNGTGATGWQLGLAFGAFSGVNPIATTGTLIGTYAHGVAAPGIGAMGTVA